MCSPVGHSLASLTIGVSAKRNALTWKYLLFCLFSGSAADLDILVGWYKGDINAWHHLGSHSVFAAVVYGGLVYLVIRLLAPGDASLKSWPVVGSLIYFSHLLLDYITEDASLPVGMQLLWPFSDRFMASPVFLIPKFMHDAEGGQFAAMIIDMFNRHNAISILIETIFLLPFLLAAFWMRKHTAKIQS